MARMFRAAFVAAALAAVTVSGYAQDVTTGSAAQDRGGRGRGPGSRPGFGREFTTATFEREWDRTQRPDLEAAGIPPEKIEQLKALQMEAEAALSRGERPNLKAMSQRREQILTREERMRLMDLRRERRQRNRGTDTTGTRPMSGAANSQTTASGTTE